MTNHNHKNNKIINYKELKKNWETNIIWALIIVSSYAVGIFTGSMNWDATYNGYYHPTTPQTPPVLADTTTEVLDTDLFMNIGWDANITMENHIGANFTGRIIESNAELKTFECSINEGDWTTCESPMHLGHEMGHNLFEVRAVNGSAVDHTPAVWMWSVHE